MSLDLWRRQLIKAQKKVADLKAKIARAEKRAR